MWGGKDLCLKGIGGIIAQKKTWGGCEPHTGNNKCSLRCEMFLFHIMLRPTQAFRKTGEAGALLNTDPGAGIGPGL